MTRPRNYWWVLGILVSIQSMASPDVQDENFDLVVVGATFSGIAAAINAAEYGHHVALVEEYPDIGGLMTGGLSFTDFISYEVLGGTFLNYMQRVESYYKEKYGSTSKQVRDSHYGIHAEPHVTLEIFHQMLDEYESNISLMSRHRIESVILSSGNNSLEKITFRNLETNEAKTLSAKFFIDATYEGDLAAKSGVNYVVGRESRQQYGEVFAGKIYFDQGRILTGSTGEGDEGVQGYNFRMIMTNSTFNRVPVDKPADYDRTKYLPTAAILKNGLVSNVFSEGRDAILRSQMIPNQKADINDIKNSPVRIALLGENYEYPDGSPEIRDKIIQAHKQHILGFIYFLQNDPEMPEKHRKEASEWGLARDEFKENNYFPTRLYIREARRMVGEYVFTEHDVRLAKNSIRTKQHSDAVAIGDYALNCHGIKAQGPLYKYISEGDFGHVPPPFQIPFGVIKPKEVSNLLVSVAVSASHVGLSGLRLEPTWTALGQAAGITAHLCIKNNLSIKEVLVEDVQDILHNKGAKTIYISDIEINSPYFRVAQYFGTLGLFHVLFDQDSVELRSPNSLFGTQYKEAYPFHTLDPTIKLDKKLSNQWLNLINLDENQMQKAKNLTLNDITRGEFLEGLYKIIHSDP